MIPPPPASSSSAGEGASDTTRNRLLAAAREVFAREGYEGASVRAITTAAGANLGAVTYHFGSKEGLYHAVLESVLQPLRDQVTAVCDEPRPALERIEGVLRTFFGYLGRNPDMPRFIVQELGVQRPLPEVMRQYMSPIAERLTGVVAEGQAEGTIRPGNPFFYVLSTLAQPIYFHLVALKIWTMVVPVAPDAPELRRALVEHMARFAVNGMGTATEEDR